jgi:hypothetical protein
MVEGQSEGSLFIIELKYENLALVSSGPCKPNDLANILFIAALYTLFSKCELPNPLTNV